MRIKKSLISDEELNISLQEILFDELKQNVAAVSKGHRIQVTDIPKDLMESLCIRMNREVDNVQCFIVSNSPSKEYETTSSKLIEMRNELIGTLVVFFPNDLRTANEDSLDVSTFQRYQTNELYKKLQTRLMDKLNDNDRSFVKSVLGLINCKDKIKICKFLLGISKFDDGDERKGLSLVNLDLIPDQKIQVDGSDLLSRLSLNLHCVELLRNSRISQLERFLELDLAQGKCTDLLFKFLLGQSDLTPSVWLTNLINEDNAEDMTFDKWSFRSEPSPEFEMEILEIGIEKLTEDHYRILKVNEQDSFTVKWQTIPAPINVIDLHHFAIELVQDGSPFTFLKKPKGPSASKTRSANVSELKGLEPGVYAIRLSAYNDGDILLKETFSESFIIENSTDDPLPSPDIPRKTVGSIHEAILATAIESVERDEAIDVWKPEITLSSDDFTTIANVPVDLFINNGREYLYQVQLQQILIYIEMNTLNDPDNLGRWGLRLGKASISSPDLLSNEGIRTERFDGFMKARRSLFNAILGSSEDNLSVRLIETINLLDYAKEIVEYARSYLEVLGEFENDINALEDVEEKENLLSLNRHITSIDIVRIRMDDIEDVYLMAPTHPLKLLWGLQLARANRMWVNAVTTLDGKRPEWDEIREFISRLTSINLPNTLRNEEGHILINAENFDVFWSLFINENVKDPRALFSEVRSRLNSTSNFGDASIISYRNIIDKFDRYLDQHPYIETMVINAIKPGSASVLVNVLLEMEKKHPELSYKVNLFSDGSGVNLLGKAFDDMKKLATASRGREEMDPFLMASTEPLFPKLVYSKNKISEFIDQPKKFDAHITIMFDVFSARIEKDAPPVEVRSNFIYGLVEQYHDQYVNSSDKTYWMRQMNLSLGIDVNDGWDGLEALVELANSINRVNTYFFDPNSEKDSRLGIRLDLGPIDKNLLSIVHDSSDWVIIIDRNFGVEFLDNPFDENCPIYLIDHQPDQFNNAGHRIMVSTKQISEVTRIISPILDSIGLPSSAKEKEVLIQALGSISGRIVQKLLVPGNNSTGAIGMALARVFLEGSHLLQDMVLIPLDSHLDLFEKAKAIAYRGGNPISLQRSDLLLAEIDPVERQVTFHVIEVKFRSANSLSDLVSLKEGVRTQINNTASALQISYDPYFNSPDRVDRFVCSLELGNILNYYAERSARYRILKEENLNPLCRFIDGLEAGYSLKVKKYGLFFSTLDNGYETEVDDGILYHYVGKDKILDLIHAAADAFTTKTGIELDKTFRGTRATFTKRKPNDFGPIESSSHEKYISPKREQERKEDDHPIIEAVPPVVPPEPIVHVSNDLRCDIMIGGKTMSSQFGLIGRTGMFNVGLDINNPNAISIFGVQGSGKSYTLGTILEMSLMEIENINKLPKPLAGMVFHYSNTEEYEPEFTSILRPNSGSEINTLFEKYHALPKGLKDIVLLAPKNKVEQRIKDFPGILVRPILFDSSELNIEDWKFLMGAVGNNSMYIKSINLILKRLSSRNNLNFESIFSEIVDLNENQMMLAKMRLEFAREYIKDGDKVSDLVRPGRLIIVDLRDELTTKDEAMGLFMVLQRVFANAKTDAIDFNRIIVFDEAHNYMKTDFIEDVEASIRLMRHKGNIIVIASQDPESVPLKIIALSSLVILHRMSAPNWLKHIQKGVAALSELRPSQLNSLQSGQSFIWSAESTDNSFMNKAVKVDIRPRVTEHGGGTKKAVI